MPQVYEDILVDAEFAALIPPLSAEERQQLEENIVEQGGARDPLVVCAALGHVRVRDRVARRQPGTPLPQRLTHQPHGPPPHSRGVVSVQSQTDPPNSAGLRPGAARDAANTHERNMACDDC